MLLLPPHFYQSEDVVQISKDLLGKYLITNFEGQETVGKIVETEAYRGPDDKACHAWNNRLTDRTRVMFEAGGVAYVYLCYGVHHLFNVVTGPQGKAHAVLIRAIEPVQNIETMLLRRNMNALKPALTAGPGAMSQALAIKTTYNGVNLMDTGSPIRIEDRGDVVEESNILAGPRVGVASAGECALWPWRFVVKGSKWVSQFRK